ncbi:MAG: hypothetical protein WA705_13535 [Candidatus Ozemobacteraceae bacterium]
MSIGKKSRHPRGIALQLVLFLVLVISGLALAFFQLSSQAQRHAYRLERGEVLRQIVEAADEEAFASLLSSLDRPDSGPTQWLTDQGKNPPSLPISVPLITGIARTMIRAHQDLELSVVARVVDFTNRDFESIPYSNDAREGVGRIELATVCRLTDTGGAGGNAVCQLIRRRDYKLAAIVTPLDQSGSRSSYSQSAALDYALLVRKGLDEFRETGGLMLNQNRARLILNPTAVPAGRRGKVRFGGADGPADAFVFLNIDDSSKQMLPTANTTIDLSNADCRKLFDLDTWEALELDFKIKEAKKKLGSNYTSAVDAYLADELAKKFNKVVGAFHAGIAPIVADGPTEIASKIRSHLWNEEWKTLAGRTSNLPDRYDRPAPGFQLLGADLSHIDAAAVQEVFEGRIRKRFLYHSALFLDISSLDKEKAKEILEKPWMGLNPPPVGLSAPADVRFYDRLPEIDSAKGSGHPLFSRFDTSFLFGTSGESLSAPPNDAVFPVTPLSNRQGVTISPDKTGADGFRPYGGFGLWARRFDRDAFLRSGMYNPTTGRLAIDGIVQIQGNAPLDLGSPDQPLIVTGQGVLVSQQGFHIRGEIRKEDPNNDLLILLTRRGDIVIDTDKPIQASLIAVGDDLRRSVIPLKPMNVTGAFVVDRLNTHLWCSGEHHLQYDEALRRPQPLYRPSIGRWVVFERLAEE